MIASFFFAITLMLAILSSSQGFQPPTTLAGFQAVHAVQATSSTELGIFGGNKKNKDEETFIPGKKMNVARRKQLGVNDDEEEYDLEMALDNSTDPLITKIIAGSLIVSILALLVFGLVIPATTDYGEGVCNPLLTGGRC